MLDLAFHGDRLYALLRNGLVVLEASTRSRLGTFALRSPESIVGLDVGKRSQYRALALSDDGFFMVASRSTSSGGMLELWVTPRPEP